MKHHFVAVDKVDGMVLYRTCLDTVHLENSTAHVEDEATSQALYQHLGTLEFIFRLIDNDASGSISKDEFCMAVKTLNRFLGHEEVDDDEARAMAEAIDRDKDGRIDFNEFTESFRLVRETTSAASTVDGGSDSEGGGDDNDDDPFAVIAEPGNSLDV
jgi:hypothetical protein